MESISPEIGLIEGYHGTRPELRFVTEIVNGVIRPAGYQGPYTLVGSRGAEGLWISRTRFPGYGQDAEAMRWYNRLNRLAHQHKLSRGQIPNLLDIIKGDMPAYVEEFLEDDPGTDFDLLLPGGRPPQVAQIYIDDLFKTGQTMDIYSPDDWM